MTQSGANSIDFPATVSAGVNFSAKCVLPDFGAPAWTVSAALRGPQVINLVATGNNTEHTFSVPAATTAAWLPGDYWVSLRATNGANVEEIAQLQLKITPDLAAITGVYDGRSENEKALDAIDAVIARRATIDQQRYTINNRELWRTPMADLLKLKSFYTVAVRRERNKAAGKSGFGRAIQVRFTSP